MTAVDEAIEQFTQRRAELERDVADLAQLLAHDALRVRGDARLSKKAVTWAMDLLSLKSAALARAAGDAEVSREWHDDAFASVFHHHEGIYSDWGLDADRIDPLCAAAGVHQLTLGPAVLRKRPLPDVPFDAIVELRDGVAADPTALRRIGRELSRQLGRPVDVFLYDDLILPLPGSIAPSLLGYGVCIYHEVQESED